MFFFARRRCSHQDPTFKLHYPSVHIASFNLRLYPDFYQKKVSLTYTNDTLPTFHNPILIEKYCMNQYLKSIPMKSTVSTHGDDEKRLRETRIPGYYIYSYGKKTVKGALYEDIIYSAHVPCMCAWEREEYPVICVSFCMLIPAHLELSNNTFIWDIFQDALNRILFDFHVAHFQSRGTAPAGYDGLSAALTVLVRNFDEYLLAVTTPPKPDPAHAAPSFSVDFLQSAISNHIVSYYTILLSEKKTDSTFIYNLLHHLDIPNSYNQPYTSPNRPQVLPQPNPFFRTMSLVSYSPDLDFSLPFPFCVVDLNSRSVFRCQTQSPVVYFIRRTNAFLAKAAAELGMAFAPTTNPTPSLQTAPTSTILLPFMRVLHALIRDRQSASIPVVLLKMCDILAMKSLLLYAMFDAVLDTSHEITGAQVADVRERLGLDTEDFRVVLGMTKFAHTFSVGVYTEAIEQASTVF